MNKQLSVLIIVLIVAVVAVIVLFTSSFSMPSVTLAGQAVGAARCVDSDGGLQFLKAGTLSGAAVSAPISDSCTSATKLKEYYCGPRTAKQAVASRSYDCAAIKKVCKVGACV